MNKSLVAGAAVIVISGLGLWYYFESGSSPGPATAVSPDTSAAPPDATAVAHQCLRQKAHHPTWNIVMPN